MRAKTVARQAQPAKTTARRPATKRPRVAKAEGNAPVQAFIRALPGWKRTVAQRFDALVEREVPHVRRAIKWSSPLYGVEGQGWFASLGVFTNHVKLVFFKGALLKPPLPSGESHQMRSLDLEETDAMDEKQVASWIRQAAAIPGWGS